MKDWKRWKKKQMIFGAKNNANYSFTKMAKNNHYQEVVPFIIFSLALFLLFNLIRPMITVILSSILLSYIAFPIYSRIMKKTRKQFLSIVLSLLIISLAVLLPFSFLAFEIANQGYQFYNSFSSKISKGELFGVGCESKESKICSIFNKAEILNKEKLSGFGIDSGISKLLPFLENKLKNIIIGFPIFIAQIIFSLVISYFILKDWKIILKKIVYLIPMRQKTVTRLIYEFGNIANTVIYAQLFVAVVQGVIGTIGFYIFGIPFPIFLGVFMAFCALIPSIGTAIVWLPASIFLILSGYFSNDYLMLWKGIGLFLYGILIISMIDNLLLIKIVHAKAKVNQIIVIIGVIGGVGLFGIAGIFIGPILLPLLMTYFETFKERFR